MHNTRSYTLWILIPYSLNLCKEERRVGLWVGNWLCCLQVSYTSSYNSSFPSDCNNPWGICICISEAPDTLQQHSQFTTWYHSKLTIPCSILHDQTLLRLLVCGTKGGLRAPVCRFQDVLCWHSNCPRFGSGCSPSGMGWEGWGVNSWSSHNLLQPFLNGTWLNWRVGFPDWDKKGAIHSLSSEPLWASFILL